MAAPWGVPGAKPGMGRRGRYILGGGVFFGGFGGALAGQGGSGGQRREGGSLRRPVWWRVGELPTERWREGAGSGAAASPADAGEPGAGPLVEESRPPVESPPRPEQANTRPRTA